MRLKRRRGATLGLVAVLVLVLVILGVGFFILTKMLGGGRELANSVDAGTLNVAKQALLAPAKAARDFSNPDVASNFELLSTDGKFRLENYNRLVAQAMIVALNAKDEGTPAAAANAKKVWEAVNDVAKFLRSNHGNSAVMGGYFQNLASVNNLKMMGQNGISLNGYEIAYTARGESTNVYFDPKLQATFNSGSLPAGTGTRKSPTGNQFMAGYVPLSVNLSSGTLVFSGIPVNPQDRPHLIAGFTFDGGKSPNFMPGYPGEILPPNSFRSAGETKESHTQTFGGAVASAIVGCLDREYEAAIPNGYIEVKNGPTLPPPSADVAYTKNDIFSHALAGLGIDVAPGNTWFCRGSDDQVEQGDLKYYDTSINKLPKNDDSLADSIRKQFPEVALDDLAVAVGQIKSAINTWSTKNLIDRWADVNRMDWLAREYLITNGIPDPAISFKYIRHGDGSVPKALSEFYSIHDYTDCPCAWQIFRQGMTPHYSRCVGMLENFKKGYDQYGSSNFNDSGTGVTNLEKFKIDVLQARKTTSCCQTVVPKTEPSGIKNFSHDLKYPAPLFAHNFGRVSSPWEYLCFIDSAPNADKCARNSTIDLLLKRVQQIKPSLSKDDVIEALKSKPLPLDATFYLYVQNGKLLMSDQKPIGYSQGNSPDGKGAAAVNCGTAYNVIGNFVDVSSKGVQKISSLNDFSSRSLANGDMSLSEKLERIMRISDKQKRGFDDMPPEGKYSKRVALHFPPAETSDADLSPYKLDYDLQTDGHFPGWCYRQAPAATCTDTASWIPSTGYNNLLGQLYFTNLCSGGGQFCQPN